LRVDRVLQTGSPLSFWCQNLDQVGYRWIGIYGCTTAEYHSSMRPEPNDLGTSVRGQVGP
jgi:hypothetical protein